MKKTITFIILCAFVGNLNAQQTFSIFTYTEPAGFKKEIGKGNITYTITDNKKGSYCKIALLGALSSTGGIQTEFGKEWETNVSKNFTMLDKLQMGAVEKVNGWDAITGMQNFTFNKNTTAAIQTTFVGFGKTSGILIFLNDAGYQKYATDFLKNFSLNKPNNTAIKNTPVPNNNNSTTQQTPTITQVERDYKNAGETTGTGSVSDYSFVLPANWQVQNSPDRIVIEPKNHDYYTPTISLLPPVNGSGNIEADMNKMFFEVWRGYKLRTTNCNDCNDYYQKGKTMQGFPYYMKRTTIIKADGSDNEGIEAGVLLVQLKGRVAVIGIFKPYSLFNMYELSYLLFTLRFNNDTSLPNTLSQDILGSWCITGSSAGSCNTYYKDGSFAKGGATSTYTSHDADYNKVTTTSFGATGTYTIKGNSFSQYYKSNNTTYKSKIRFYYKKLDDKEWEFKMSKIDDSDAPEYNIPGEWDINK